MDGRRLGSFVLFNIKRSNHVKVIKGYWKDRNNVIQFLETLKQKYNLQSPNDWNSITVKQIKSEGGSKLFNNYSMYDLKFMACPEGKLLYKKPKKSKGYWEDKQKLLLFLEKLKQKYNLQTVNDWNSITAKNIQSEGGGSLLHKYSMYDLKCLAFPDGKDFFNKPQQPPNYWDNYQNVILFLEKLKEKYNLQSPNDWNSITYKQIQLEGGGSLFNKYSIYDLKCIACPEGEITFDKPSGYWKDQQNTLQFLEKLKEKYNLQTADEWNSITTTQIKLEGGSSLFNTYSMHDLKCLVFPSGESLFDKPSGYWKDKQNVLQFLEILKQKYNLQSADDWNSITNKQIQSEGGSAIFNTYSIYDLKCMAYPEGKKLFNKPNKAQGYWNDIQNINQFLEKLKQKYNLQSADDWNSITNKQIQLEGGSSLLHNYSIFDLKCLAYPEGKSMFDKPSGYWKDKQNVLQFLEKLKQKYNIQSAYDWNLITKNQIKLEGGSSLFNIYSMYDLKCLACPNDTLLFAKQNQSKPASYWDDENKRNEFIENLKSNFCLKTPQDWQRLSTYQIRSHGGHWLFYDNKNYLEKTFVDFEIQDNENKTSSVRFSLKELIHSNFKRSSQRWLLLQVQKLFPHEEIVEDYFHSEISRKTGSPVQFDIFLINRKIAIEYHGKHHYEDIPSGFAPLEMHQNRDLEKQTLCRNYGIQLIIIPYWWDNHLDSLKNTLYSAINET